MSCPVVRVPRPNGTPESKSFPQHGSESMQALFDRCLAYRDKRGVEVWGKARWKQMLQVQKRSVVRHRSNSQTPYTGVCLEQRKGRAPAWVASWYALLPDGSRRKCSQTFSFGTERAKYSTSSRALAAAIARRKVEEVKWYCTLGPGTGRKANPL